MDLETEEMYESLIHWVSSLHLASGAPTIQSISSGQPIVEALSLIDPEYFGNPWPSAMPSIDANWRVKASSLRRVIARLSDWYSEVYKRPIPQSWQPDVKLIAQGDDSSKASVTHVLQLLVGVAVHCANKRKFIENILALDLSVQGAVMRAINDLEQRTAPVTSSENNNNNSNALASMSEELTQLKSEREDLANRCFELDNQVASLQEEKHFITVENQRLLSRISEAGNMDDVNTAAGRKFQQLSQNIERLQADLEKTEQANEELQAKLEGSVKEKEDLIQRLEDSSATEQLYRKAKDEADELKSKAAEVKRLESQLDTFRRKIEEQGDLKAQVKILEKKNENYMKSVIELEEEQRKNTTLKTQLEAYKCQMTEMDTKLTAEVKRADKADFECKRLQEKFDIERKEKERVVGERDYWKDYTEELRATKDAASSSEDSPRHSDIFAAGSSAELRDRLQRLEAENQMLRESACSSEQLDLVRSESDIANARKQELETELRLCNQRLLETEGKLEDVQSDQEQREAGGDARLAAKHQQVEKLSVEAERLRQQLEDTEKQLGDKDTLVTQLRAQVETKESEHRVEQCRFKASMEKARTVIVGLERGRMTQSRSNSSVGDMSRTEFDSLRKELELKDKQLQRFVEDQERMRILKEQEERLVTSAYHNMAMQQQRNAARDRISSSQNRSFLGRQRDVVSPRRSTATGTLSSSLLLCLLLGVILLYVLFGACNPLLLPLERVTAAFGSLLHSQMSLGYVDGPPPV